jgi:hypothetical protein
VIVRIATEGQYELDDEGLIAELNELDNAAVSACEGGSEEEFHATYGRLLELVRTRGRPVADDLLAGSDLILPPPDVTLEEARAEFTGEGLLPN